MPRLELKSKSKKPLTPTISSYDILNKDARLPKKFVSSGSDMLNLALTGDIDRGYPIGRIINICGDKSTGKSLAVVELCNILFYQEHKKNKKSIKIIYDDSEFAFDFDLAEQFNVPIDFIEWKNSRTVEEFHKNLYKTMKDKDKYDVILYVIDSLDALSDEAEQDRMKKFIDTDKKEGSFGAQKAKYLSEFFRMAAGDISNTNCILMIVSQIRDKLGVMFGEKYSRSGGRALDFYASQVIWLKDKGQIVEGKHKISQGVTIEANIKKNKVAPPRRKVEFNIIYGYGIDNITSLIDFGLEVGTLEKSGNSIIWDDEKYKRKDLILLFEKHKTIFQEFRKKIQESWITIENEAKLERIPKWEKEE
jgi:recombination protein RecA